MKNMKEKTKPKVKTIQKAVKPKEEITYCPECKGIGEIFRNFSGCMYEDGGQICPYCNGTGR